MDKIANKIETLKAKRDAADKKLKLFERLDREQDRKADAHLKICFGVVLKEILSETDKIEFKRKTLKRVLAIAKNPRTKDFLESQIKALPPQQTIHSPQIPSQAQNKPVEAKPPQMNTLPQELLKEPKTQGEIDWDSVHRQIENV